MYTCFINSTEFKMTTNFSFVRDLTYRTRTTIEVLKENQTFFPSDKDRVEIFDNNGNRVYFGKVEGSDSPSFGSGFEIDLYKLDLISIDSVLDDRHINEVFEDTDVNDVIEYIFNNFVVPEGIASNLVVDDYEGIPVSKIVWDDESVEIALNDLSDLVGSVWYIDSITDTFYFKRYDNVDTYPEIFDDTSKMFFSLQQTIDSLDVRNVQTLKGATSETDVLQEFFAGDGERTTFTVAFPVARKPELYLNAVQIPPDEIGVRGIDDSNESIKWFFAFQSTEISQVPTAIPLETTDVLQVNYNGIFNIKARVEDETAIEERQLRVGGTGIVEAVNETNSFNEINDIIDIAQDKIDRFKEARKELTLVLKADDTGIIPFDVGILLDFDYAQFNLHGKYFITEINYTYRTFNSDITILNAEVKAVQGDLKNGYAKIFGEIKNSLDAVALNENESTLINQTINNRIQLESQFIVNGGVNPKPQNTSPTIENSIGFAQIHGNIYPVT